MEASQYFPTVISRKQLAIAYEVSDSTLRRILERHNIVLPARTLLLRSDIEPLVKVLGPPIQSLIKPQPAPKG
jgi:hypothetical protein